ncbi:cytochrome P450 [Neoconidiobolus thromboides FSU 785]|nr:cytochrome P450 [Neoconidiobolus thromboides FSU 785]
METISGYYIFIIALCYWSYKVIYNLFFSPLRKIPGPLINQFFPFLLRYYLFNGTIHLYVTKLHEKYGKTIRLNWDNVSFSSDEAANQIYSTYTFPKSKRTNGFQIIGETILSTRDREFHRQRKKILAFSFSDKTISNIEYLVKRNVDILVNKIEKMALEEKDFNIGLFFHYFSFDVIGDVAYGKSFDMLKNGYHPVIGWIKNFFFLAVLVSSFSFLKHFKFESVTQLYKFSYEAVKNAKEHSDRVTILSTLINASNPDTGKTLSEKEIVEESIIQLVAGSDTTSNSLIWTFYLLSKYPETYNRLKEELIDKFPNKEEITFDKCKESVYLRAVIYESLRILPVVAGNLIRNVPKGGKVIEGYFVPENTTISISINALHNSNSNWDNPHSFDPGRWIDEDGQFQSNNNFSPFSIGPRACLGRNLAWMELYLVTASLVRNFSFKLKTEVEVGSKLYVVNSPERDINVFAFKHDK